MNKFYIFVTSSLLSSLRMLVIDQTYLGITIEIRVFAPTLVIRGCTVCL